MWILDTECYSNVWLLCMQHKDTGERKQYMLPDLTESQRDEIKTLLRTNYTVGFNSLSYDLPMIAAAVIDGKTNEQLKDLSDKLILSEQPSWLVCNNEGISVPELWTKRHVDLIEIAIGQASLKIYGGRLNCNTMQDLPLDPTQPVPDHQLDTLITYCFNDISVTQLLLEHLWKQVLLRDKISRKYGVNLRSKSDAQMAEAVIKKLVSEAKGEQVFKPKTRPNFVTYTSPEYIQFSSKTMQDTLHMITETSFPIHKSNGSVVMPEWLAKTVIEIDGARYQMGIGGLHSCEKRQYVAAGDDHVLADWDVASMYPTMIVNQRLAPENMGKHFTEIYKGFVTERLAAKHSGDKVTADTLKIFLNGSFGKFGSRFSILYSPKLLIQTTLTGQLSLLMLIERVTAAGIRVVSANTDGVVMHCPKDREKTMDEITFEWMLDTNMMLERTDYRLIASRDVNSYVAVKTNGEIKRKGAFADQSLAKNPDRLIIYDAVCAYLAEGDPIITTVMNCKDITRFVTVRRVTGGAMWRGMDIGKAVRFYHSSKVDPSESLTYKKNGNKVPNSDGCRPIMVLGKRLPGDIDYLYYIQESRKLLKEIGL
jgi:hypothetical protein